MKHAKKRSEGIRSLEVVWALNVLWIGLGNYYAGGFKDPRWLLAGAVLYALTSFRLLGSHFLDPWIVGYVVMCVIGHVKVRRHNEKVFADQMRSGKRAIFKDVRAVAQSQAMAAADSPARLPDSLSQEVAPANLAGAAPSTDPARAGVARPTDFCPSCAAPRDPMRFSCPQCAYMYDG